MDKDTIYMIRVYIAIATIVFSVLAFTGGYYPIPFLNMQVAPAIAKLIANISVLTLVFITAVTVATFIFGRIYCSTICPLGILQEIFTYISRKKVFNKNQPYKYFIMAVAFGFLFGGSTLIIRYLDPYTIFGSILSYSIFGIFAAVAILALVFFKKRYFCTNICPVGALLGLISKLSLYKISIDTDKCASCGLCEKTCPSGCINLEEKTVDNETCIKCLRCSDVCQKDAINFKRQKTTFNPKRRDFIVSASSFVLFGSAVVAGMGFVKTSAKKLKEAILPAGAGNINRMENKCINCNLCVKVCPTKVLEKANEDCKTVHINYDNGSFGEKYCDYNCNKCGKVCPTGAIKKLKLEEKQRTRTAVAVIDSKKCKTCRLCILRCPTFAISQDKNMKIVLDSSKCIGCGQCKSFCRFGAVKIIPVDEQTTI